MNKCNLFRPLDNASGNFLTFSQYSEDLTKEYTQKDNYRVVPCKFMCVDLQIDKLNKNNRQLIISEIFQNYFENLCSIIRTDGENPNVRGLLLQTLSKYKLINEVGDTDKYYDEVKWIGDINIYSYNEVGDVGYNEIYCMVPEDAKRTRYFLSENPDEIINKNYNSNNIIGWNDDYPTNSKIIKELERNDMGNITKYYDEKSSENYIYNINKFRDIKFLEKTTIGDTNEILDDRSFSFNSIIVFYDIQSSDNNIIQKNIPLGIYFTGMPDGDSITNNINKYTNTSSEQGTSYGLRICSKYLSQPFISQVTTNLTASTDIYPEYSQLISLMKDSQKLMNENINIISNQNSAFKLHLNEMAGNRTNIPYIREVADEKYWFVNGRNTGQSADNSNIYVSKNNNNTIELKDADGNTCVELKDGVVKVKDLDIQKFSINTIYNTKNPDNPYITGNDDGSASFNAITAPKATITDITGASASFDTITGTSASFNTITGTSASFENLDADITGASASFENLDAGNITIINPEKEFCKFKLDINNILKPVLNVLGIFKLDVEEWMRKTEDMGLLNIEMFKYYFEVELPVGVMISVVLCDNNNNDNKIIIFYNDNQEGYLAPYVWAIISGKRLDYYDEIDKYAPQYTSSFIINNLVTFDELKAFMNGDKSTTKYISAIDINGGDTIKYGDFLTRHNIDLGQATNEDFIIESIFTGYGLRDKSISELF